MKKIEKIETSRKTVCLPDELWSKIDADSERTGMTQNGVLRCIVQMYYDEIDGKEVK